MFSLAEWAEEGLMGHRIHICLKENVKKKKRKCSTFSKWLYHPHSHWPCMRVLFVPHTCFQKVVMYKSKGKLLVY